MKVKFGEIVRDPYTKSLRRELVMIVDIKGKKYTLKVYDALSKPSNELNRIQVQQGVDDLKPRLKHLYMKQTASI